jgi:hypothetical protein
LPRPYREKDLKNDGGLIGDKAANRLTDQGCRRLRLVRASSRDA